MKQFIACLLLGGLFGLTPPPVSAQQHQSPQHSALEIEALKKRVAVLQRQLQTVENVEKMELVKNYTDVKAKLADANAKLINAEFGKFERELRDANNGWLIKWGIFALTFLAVVGASALAWVKSRTNQLIADGVEENLNGFKEAVDQIDVMKEESKEALNELKSLQDQQRILEKQYAVSALESIIDTIHWTRRRYPERIKRLSDQALLQVFDDEKCDRGLRYGAGEILTTRKFEPLVALLLEFLNSAVDWEKDRLEAHTFHPLSAIGFLERIDTPESYQGLTKYLNRLLTEDPKHNGIFLSDTVSALAGLGVQLNMADSAPILKKAIPQSKTQAPTVPRGLTEYFEKFDDSEGIQAILTTYGTNLPSGEVKKCLELLKKHNPDFVANWRAQHNTGNAESS